MKTIYLVTSGEYSDYGIQAVFSKKVLAENFIASFSKNGGSYIPTIEEWEMDPKDFIVPKGYHAYKVSMDKEGNSRSVDTDTSHYFWKNVRFFGKKEIVVECFARDEKHAIKIANEKRLFHIASNSWGKNL